MILNLKQRTHLLMLAAHLARAMLPFVTPLETKGAREGRAPAGTRGPCAKKLHTQRTGENHR